MLSAPKVLRNLIRTALGLTGICWVLGVASVTADDCVDRLESKKALFGDLHIHTRYSFDSYTQSQRNGPNEAYQYAKGEAITLPDAAGRQNRLVHIDRPLDFAAVTDHAEFLGQVDVCTADPWRLGYWWPHCMMTRADNLWIQLLAAQWWTSLGGQSADEPELTAACLFSDCDTAGASVWREIQAAAAHHNDDSDACEFTTFVAYEYTDAQDQRNMHRNVIFRNQKVTPAPISIYDTDRKFTRLWDELKSQCLDSDSGCDVLAIPHNSNLAGGKMFRNPLDEQEAQDRLRIEPLVELVQHKGASECRFDRLAGLGVDTEDELCDFEQIPADNLHMLGSVNGEMRSERGEKVAIDQFARRNLVRNALKDGLLLGEQSGTNPFKLGFIGSTDTHSATPGAAQEFDYAGHLGRRDAQYRNIQDHFAANPGGLAVVWAEENSRDAVFDALRRRETYATSGTRPTVRFFAGSFDADVCTSPDLASIGYQQGVPMGTTLTSAPDRLQFLVAAAQDAGTALHPGTALERLQIVKGWVDSEGQARERVVDVAGSATIGLGVDPNSCAPQNRGQAQLCAVWEDPEYDPAISAFYYVRVLEAPTCRWSTLQCQAAGVNPLSEQCSTQARQANSLLYASGEATGPVYEACCTDASNESFYQPVIQERAWTSPIWIE
jgi:hypothetical protein